MNKIQPQNQKTELQTEHFSSFLDCPEDGEKKCQPLRRKTGKRTEVFGRNGQEKGRKVQKKVSLQKEKATERPKRPALKRPEAKRRGKKRKGRGEGVTALFLL